MTDDELAQAAGLHEVRTLRAIRAVESNGHPAAVRFEPQLFRRLTRHLYDARVPYSPDAHGIDRVSADTNRAAFDRAFLLDQEMAVRATSWGLYQELGAALLPVTPGGPADDVAAFDADPEGCSEMMFISFCVAHPHFVEAANAHDWARAAYLYNGPGNVPRYSAALQHAYEHAAA